MTTHDTHGKLFYSKNNFLFFHFLELKLLFSLFDTDHDGRITQDEVKQLVETASGHPWTEEQLIAFMQTVDTDSKYKLILFNSLEVFLCS
jgi:Ca2+-binding EF-hand superfamily protein